MPKGIKLFRMTRRKFLPALAAGGAVLSKAETKTPSIYEIRTIYLRNTTDNESGRLRDFLQHSALPAFARAGIGPVGIFSPVIAADSPFFLSVVSYPSLAAMDQQRAALLGDSEYTKALAAYNEQPASAHPRVDSLLGRAFQTVPAIEMPDTKTGHIFELRRYESNTSSTLARKIKMFESGEIAIFRKLGMNPFFFAETIVGPRMPNLIYMLSFADLASREKLWKAFGSDPAWQKMRSAPGNSDAEIVSNISNWILSPLPFSQIR